VVEKLSKYKVLEAEAARTWGLKTVPVVIGALDLVKKRARRTTFSKFLATSA